MKKFFSIFCALAIVLSVTAAPVSKKDFADKKDAKKELRQHKAEVKKAPARMAEFKSFEKKAAVAQQVAHLSDTQKVMGSIPVGHTISRSRSTVEHLPRKQAA